MRDGAIWVAHPKVILALRRVWSSERVIRDDVLRKKPNGAADEGGPPSCVLVATTNLGPRYIWAVLGCVPALMGS